MTPDIALSRAAFCDARESIPSMATGAQEALGAFSGDDDSLLA